MALWLWTLEIRVEKSEFNEALCETGNRKTIKKKIVQIEASHNRIELFAKTPEVPRKT